MSKKWTVDLCRKDSDGDGKTKGQELGDPNCVWVEGIVPELQDGLSHPGKKYIISLSVVFELNCFFNMKRQRN